MYALRPIVAAATFLVATPALAAADLSVSIPATAPVHVYDTASYAVDVSNVGNRNANQVQLTIQLPETNTSPSVYVMGSVDNISSACSQVGTTLVCDLGRIRKNKSKSVSFDLELPQAAAPLELHASVTTSSNENSTANNDASYEPVLLNYDVAVAPGDIADVQHCTGQDLTSFFECVCSPSSISAHQVEFHSGGTLSFPNQPATFAGTWSQPTSDSLVMTYTNNGSIVAEFEGYGSSPGCFEGLTTFGSSSPWVAPYEVCL